MKLDSMKEFEAEFLCKLNCMCILENVTKLGLPFKVPYETSYQKV